LMIMSIISYFSKLESIICIVNIKKEKFKVELNSEVFIDNINHGQTKK